jgi:hypothetical protein
VGGRIYIRADVAVMSGQEVVAHTSALAREAETKKGMDDSQITGTASSYARKYALNGLFAIDDTKDADTDEHKHQASKPEKLVVELDQNIVAQFESCGSLDELREVWEGLKPEQRNVYAEVKNQAKKRLS